MEKKYVKTSDNNYEVINESPSCGDCIKCQDRCENGISEILSIWTPEEVEAICALVGKDFNSELKDAMVMK